MTNNVDNKGPDSERDAKKKPGKCKTCYWSTYYPVAENDRMMWCGLRKEFTLEESECDDHQEDK